MPEPTTIFAGDTVMWEKTAEGYPASEWQGTYTAVTADEQQSFPTTANGDTFVVNLSATTTAKWNAGDYRWIFKVQKGAEVYTVDFGVWEVLVDLAQQKSGYDARSHAQIVVDGLESLYEEYVQGKALLSSYSIGDTLFSFRTVDDLIAQIDKARAMLSREEERERIARGKQGRRVIKLSL